MPGAFNPSAAKAITSQVDPTIQAHIDRIKMKMHSVMGPGETAKRMLMSVANIPAAIPSIYTIPDSARDVKNIFIDKDLSLLDRPDMLPGATAVQEGIDKYQRWVRGALGLPEEDPILSGDVGRTVMENLDAFILPSKSLSLLGKLGAAGSKTKKVGKVIDNIITGVSTSPQTAKGKLALGGLQVGATGGLASIIPNEANADEPIVPPNPNSALSQPLAVANPRTTPAELQGHINKIKMSMQNEQDTGLGWKDYAAGGLAVGMAYFGHKAFTRSRAMNAVTNASAYFGQNPPPPAHFGTLDKAYAVSMNRDEPILDIAKELGDTKLGDMVETLRPGGSHEGRMRDLAITGRITGHNRLFPKLADLITDVAKLDPAQMNKFRDAVKAGDRLTMYGRNRVRHAMQTGESVADYSSKLTAARIDPTLNPLLTRYQQMGHEAAHYLHANGMIDTVAKNEWTRPGTFYMPWYSQDKNGIFSNLVDILAGTEQYGSGSFLKNLESRKGPVKPGVKLVDPEAAMAQYMSDMIRGVDENNIRMRMINGMENHPRLRSLIRKAKGNDDYFTVYVNGKQEKYHITDPLLHDTVKFTPDISNLLIKSMQATTNVFTKFTTGPGNPLAAIRSGIYDMVAATGTARADKPYTYSIGEIAHALGMTPATTGIFARLMMFNTGHIPLIGLAQGLALGSWGAGIHLKGALSNSFSTIFSDMAKSMAASGNSYAAPIEHLAKYFGDVYANSTYSNMTRLGVNSSRYLKGDETFTSVKALFRELSPSRSASPGLIKTYNIYHGLLESLQNGARTYYFYKHGKHLGDDVDALMSLAKDTRQLTGDFGKSGGGVAFRAARAGIPYFNASLQSIAAMGKAARRDPFSFLSFTMSTLISGAMGATYFLNSSDENADIYLNQMSEKDRNDFIWFAGADGTPKAIPIPSEMRPILSLGRSIAEGMYRDSREHPENPWTKELWTGLVHMFDPENVTSLVGALGSASPVSGIQPLNIAKAVAGYRTPMGSVFDAQKVSPTPYDRGMATPYVQNLISTIFGTMGGTIIKTLDDGTMNENYGIDMGKTMEAFAAHVVGDNPIVSPLFSGYGYMPRGRSVPGDQYSEKKSALSQITGASDFLKEYDASVMTSGDFSQPFSGNMKTPLKDMSEESIFAIQFVTKRASKVLAPLTASLGSLYKKQDEVKNSTTLGPMEKRNLSRKYNTLLSRTHLYLNRQIQLLIEEPLSERLGRPITLEEIADNVQMTTKPIPDDADLIPNY